MKSIKISLKKKNRKQQYGQEWYKNLPEDEEWRLVEKRKTCKIWKINYFTNKNWLMFLISTLNSLCFANIKNSRARLKTHQKWSTLTFSCSYKKIFVLKIVFQRLSPAVGGVLVFWGGCEKCFRLKNWFS